MKFKECARLGKISLKSEGRKRSTKATVRGIAFSLCFLVPVLFFTMAFYIDLTAKVNQTETIATMNVTTKNIYDVDKNDTCSDDYALMPKGALMSYNSLKRTMDDISETYDTIAYEKFIMGAEKYYEYASDGRHEVSAWKLKIGDSNYNPVSFRLTDYFDNGQYFEDDDTVKPEIAVYHLDLTNNRVALDSELYDLNNSEDKNVKISDDGNSDKEAKIFRAGGKFKAGGKKQVIFSEAIASKLGLTTSDIGKKLSLKYTSATAGSNRRFMGNIQSVLALDNDAISTNAFSTVDSEGSKDISIENLVVMNEFELVGIVKDNFFRLGVRKDFPQIWLSSESVYYNEGANENASLRPTVTPIQKDPSSQYYINESHVATYKNAVYTKVNENNINADFSYYQNKAIEKGVIFPLFGITEYDNGITGDGGYTIDQSVLDAPEFPAMKQIVQAKNYQQCNKMIKAVSKAYGELYVNIENANFSHAFMNEVFMNFSMVNTVGQYIILGLYIFGGIILFTTLLNLYNSINAAIEQRKYYLGVMRAVGAPQKLMYKLSFVEMLLIFLKAMIAVTIVSLVVSIGLKIGLDIAFKYAGEMFGVVLKINFLYYPVALVVVFGIMLLIGFIFSRIACKQVASKPILEVLSDDK